MESFHAYISNRQPSLEKKQYTVVSWNRINNLIAAGQENGIVNVLKVEPNPLDQSKNVISIAMTLIDHKHSITSIAWNERFGKLATGDSSGLIIIWAERDSKWILSMSNDYIHSAVVSIRSSPNGESFIMAFEDGTVICGDVSGNRKWIYKATTQPTNLTWLPNAKFLYIATSLCKVLYLKTKGSNVDELSFPEATIEASSDRVVSMDYTRQAPFLLLVTFRSGDILIMTSMEDKAPKQVSFEVEITAASWSNDGQMFAVAGIVQSGACSVIFASRNGDLIRSLSVTAMSISGLSFSPFDSQLAITADRSLCLAKIVPSNSWAYFKGTLVYSVKQASNHALVFFNRSKGQTHTKSISGLLGLAACKEYVLVGSTQGDSTALITLNEYGTPLNSAFVPFKPQFFAASETFSIVASERVVCAWNLSTNAVCSTRLQSPISSIASAASNLYVSFTNGEFSILTLPGFEIVSQYAFPVAMESIALSSDLTRISTIDIHGNLFFLDIHSGIVSKEPRKETWDMKWADDHPGFLTALERQRLYVYKEFKPIEPILSTTNICEFTSLVVTTVDFSEIYKNPFNPSSISFREYESKPLRDLKHLLQCNAQLEEVLSFVKKEGHKVLWKILGDHCLELCDLKLAEKCYTEAQSQIGVKFVKYISSVTRGSSLQKGYIRWYLKQYTEAIPLLEEAKRRDLVVKLYLSSGQWEKAAESASDLGDEAMIEIAYKNLGNDYVGRGLWSKAAQAFSVAGDLPNQLKSLFRANDIIGLSNLIMKIRPPSALLTEIGMNMVAVGCHEKAVEAFIRNGEVQTAVDACVHLNQWEYALKVASEHSEIDKQTLMSKYAHHLAFNGRMSKAIRLFMRFKLTTEAAILLDQEGDTAFKASKILFAKKCYVFAASLMAKDDAERAKSLWFKAEAVHFLMLVNRKVCEKKWEEAVFASVRLYEIYSDFVGREVSASIMALCTLNAGYFKQCSFAFSFLEHSEKFSKRKQERFEQLAVKIFSKHLPEDPPVDKESICPKCGGVFEGLSSRCKCGYAPNGSIVTGRSMIAGNQWKCSCCGRSALVPEVAELKFCPLCHHKN